MQRNPLSCLPWIIPRLRIEGRHGFSTLAVCHLLLHPIALTCLANALARIGPAMLSLRPIGTINGHRSATEDRGILRQTTEITRVKARIKALAEKTVSNGCTEAEAMAAAEMVGRLLERYALSMEEIDLREERCVQLNVPIGGKQRRPIDGCVTAIARFCDCKVWVARDGVTPSYVFFGFEADTALGGYLFN